MSIVHLGSLCRFFVNWFISGGSNVNELLQGWAEPGVQSWAVLQAVGILQSLLTFSKLPF